MQDMTAPPHLQRRHAEGPAISLRLRDDLFVYGDEASTAAAQALGESAIALLWWRYSCFDEHDDIIPRAEAIAEEPDAVWRFATEAAGGTEHVVAVLNDIERANVERP